MREVFQFLEKIIQSDMPVWGGICTALFILLLSLILSPTTGAKLIDLFLLKKKRITGKQLSKKYFLNYPIFDYLSYNLMRLKSCDFGSEGKTNAIKDLLYLKLTIYKAKIKEFIGEGINITDKFDFKHLVHKTILKAEDEYQLEWQKLKLPVLDELIKDYNVWHNQSAVFARIAICNITNSDIYDNILERMQEILCILETKFRVTMPDIEKGLAEANGKYADLDYKSEFF